MSIFSNMRIICVIEKEYPGCSFIQTCVYSSKKKRGEKKEKHIKSGDDNVVPNLNVGTDQFTFVVIAI